MRRLSALPLSALLVLAGCAGRDFTRPPAGQIVLGKTTYQEITSTYGKPEREGEILKNGENVKMLVYGYGRAGFFGAADARSAAYYFLGDRLVAYEYISSFDEDRTMVDDARVPEVKIGTSTESQVIAMFGAPSGMAIYPMVNGRDDRSLSYASFKKGAFGKFDRKQLIVTIDPAGLVKDVQFTKSGSPP